MTGCHGSHNRPPSYARVMEPVRTGRYRHYKGGEYEVLGEARHSETEEALVLYRPLVGDSGLWVRPKAMFLESVLVAGVEQPRFAFLV